MDLQKEENTPSTTTIKNQVLEELGLSSKKERKKVDDIKGKIGSAITKASDNIYVLSESGRSCITLSQKVKKTGHSTRAKEYTKAEADKILNSFCFWNELWDNISTCITDQGTYQRVKQIIEEKKQHAEALKKEFEDAYKQIQELQNLPQLIEERNQKILEEESFRRRFPDIEENAVEMELVLMMEGLSEIYLDNIGDEQLWNMLKTIYPYYLNGASDMVNMKRFTSLAKMVFERYYEPLDSDLIRTDLEMVAEYDPWYFYGDIVDSEEPVQTEAPIQAEAPVQAEAPTQVEPQAQTEVPTQTEPQTQTEVPTQTEPQTQTEVPDQAEMPAQTEAPDQVEMPAQTEVPDQVEMPAQAEVPVQAETDSEAPKKDTQKGDSDKEKTNTISVSIALHDYEMVKLNRCLRRLEDPHKAYLHKKRTTDEELTDASDVSDTPHIHAPEKIVKND